jgi:hypothetical protein
MKLQMNTDKHGLELKQLSSVAKFLFLASLLVFFDGCKRNIFQPPPNNAPTTLRDVLALRLNFRFETDVPAPTVNQTAQTEERNAAVQTDFDQNRTPEILEKTLTSPDKQRVWRFTVRRRIHHRSFAWICIRRTENSFAKSLRRNGGAFRRHDCLVARFERRRFCRNDSRQSAKRRARAVADK